MQALVESGCDLSGLAVANLSHESSCVSNGQDDMRILVVVIALLAGVLANESMASPDLSKVEELLNDPLGIRDASKTGRELGEVLEVLEKDFNKDVTALIAKLDALLREADSVAANRIEDVHNRLKDLLNEAHGLLRSSMNEAYCLGSNFSENLATTMGEAVGGVIRAERRIMLPIPVSECLWYKRKCNDNKRVSVTFDLSIRESPDERFERFRDAVLENLAQAAPDTRPMLVLRGYSQIASFAGTTRCAVLGQPMEEKYQEYYLIYNQKVRVWTEIFDITKL